MRNYATKTERVWEIFLRFQLPNTIPIHFHSFKITTKCPFYSPFSYHLPKLILIFLLKKVVGINIFKICIENYVRGKREPQMIRVYPLKRRRREMKEDPKLGGQWKVPMLSGQWNVPMEGGQWNVKEKHFFTSSHFPPNKFYLNLQFFPLTLKFYFTMVLGRYSRISFLFFDL